jgi:hypothetical protein
MTTLASSFWHVARTLPSSCDWLCTLFQHTLSASHVGMEENHHETPWRLEQIGHQVRHVFSLGLKAI